MSVNKVIYNGNSLIDLTEDTVTPETLAEGVTAHDKSGALIVGTMKSSEDLNNVLTEQEELIATLKDTLEGKAAGGGGSDTRFTDLIMDTITDIDDSTITTIRSHGFAYVTSLKTVKLPNVTKVATNAFRNCTNLESLDLPNATLDAQTYMCQDCTSLKYVNIPKITRVQNRAFSGCSELEKIDLGELLSIGSYVFVNCAKFTTLIIRATSKIATLSGATSFDGTPIASGTGYIYVPAALLSTYQSATNWVTYSAQFRAIEDYPDICGG